MPQDPPTDDEQPKLATRPHHQIELFLTGPSLTHFQANNGAQQYTVLEASSVGGLWRMLPADAPKDFLRAFLITVADFVVALGLEWTHEDLMLIFEALCIDGTNHAQNDLWGLEMITYSQGIIYNRFINAPENYSILSLHSFNGVFVARFVDRDPKAVPFGVISYRPITPIHGAFVQLADRLYKFGQNKKTGDSPKRVLDLLYTPGQSSFDQLYDMVKMWNKMMNEKECDVLLCKEEIQEDITVEENLGGKELSDVEGDKATKPKGL
jgi:hypothetical protein